MAFCRLGLNGEDGPGEEWQFLGAGLKAEAQGFKLDELRVQRFVLGIHDNEEGRLAKPDPQTARTIRSRIIRLRIVPKPDRLAEAAWPRWPVRVPLAEWCDLTRTGPRPLIDLMGDRPYVRWQLQSA